MTSIIYPYFLECCEYTDDEALQTIFEQLALGQPPPNTYITKSHFWCCNQKDKEFSYKIERKPPKELFDEVVSKVSLHYKPDQKVKDQEEDQDQEAEKEKKQPKDDEADTGNKTSKKVISEKKSKDKGNLAKQDWATLRKKNVKDTLFEKFVIDMKARYKLSLKQARCLLGFLNLSLIIKVITAKDIHYENNEIQSINGITFTEGNYSFDKPLFTSTSESSCLSSCDDSNWYEEEMGRCWMYENWNKYLKGLMDQLS
jgi:hypothetical protein